MGLFATVLFRVSTRMRKISLKSSFWFIAISGGQGVGGMNKCSASVYDERFPVLSLVLAFLNLGLGSWAI